MDKENKTRVGEIVSDEATDRDMIVPVFEIRGKKWAVIRAVIILLAVLIAAGSVFYVLNRKSVNEFFKRVFSSPKDYFAYVEKRDLSDKTNVLVKGVSSVASALNNEGEESTLTARITISDTAKNLVSLTFDTDLSSFKSSEIVCSTERERDDLLMNLSLYLNDFQISSGDAALSLRTNELFFLIPDLSDVPASVDLSEELGLIVPGIPPAASGTAKLDPETINELTGKYLDAVLAEFGSFTKKGGTLEASGVKQRCTVLTAEATTSEFYRAQASLIRTMMQDEKTSSVLRAFLDEYAIEYSISSSGSDGKINDEKLFSELLTRAESLAAEAEKNEKQHKDEPAKMLILSDYVDKSGNIIGRTVEYNGEEVLSFGFAENGDDFGFTAKYYGKVVADGNGKTKNKAVSGTFKLYDLSKNELMTVKVKDLDREGIEKGAVNGEFVISPSQRLYDLLPFDTGNIPPIFTNNLEFEVGVYTGSDAVRAEIAPRFGGIDFGKLTLELTKTAREVPTAPERDEAVRLTSPDDLSAWLEDFDPDDLTEKLAEAGLSEELLDLLTDTVGW